MMPAQMEKLRQTMGGKSKALEVMPQINKMMDVMSQELSWTNLKDGYIAIYADVFTTVELKGLVAFYKSPAGQAYALKQPELTQRTAMLTQEIMIRIMPKIQAMTKAMKAGTAKPPSAPEQGK